MVKEKLTSNEAIAKIQVMINNFNLEIMERDEPNYSEWDTQINREFLLYKIEDVVGITEVDGKLLIVEQIKSDESKKKTSKLKFAKL